MPGIKSQPLCLAIRIYQCCYFHATYIVYVFPQSLLSKLKVMATAITSRGILDSDNAPLF